MQKYLFIDRDGTLIEGPPSGGQIDSFDKLHFYPNVITWLSRIANELDYTLVMVTNQNGLGTPMFTQEMFLPTQNFMLNVFKNEGIHFKEIIIDNSFPEDDSPLRKPRIGRMHAYINNPDVDMQNSFVIGDRITDVQFAKNLGCKGIFLNPENLRGQKELTDTIEELKAKWAALASTSWKDVYLFLKSIKI
jgi:imidazoleglycerol-phosphate dehydratase / histidinol-phosphatase